MLKLKKKTTAIRLLFLKDVDIEKSISIYQKFIWQKKTIFYYLYDSKIKPLHVMLPKTGT